MPSAWSPGLLPACLGDADALAGAEPPPLCSVRPPLTGSLPFWLWLHVTFSINTHGSHPYSTGSRMPSVPCQASHAQQPLPALPPFQHPAVSDVILQCTQPPLPPGQPESQGKGQAADDPAPCTCQPHCPGCIPARGPARTACWQDWMLRGPFAGGLILHLI